MLELLWIFLLYSFFGWCLEVIYAAIKTKQLVNRGFLNGPICPIYGVGAAVLIPILSPLSEHLPLLFLSAVILASVLELIGGYLLKRLFHISWWDYSENRFNIGGYICLQFSLIWGLCGVIMVRVIQPPLAHGVSLLPFPLLAVILVLFYTYFLVDVTVTMLSIRNLNRDLQEITHLVNLIRKGSDAMAEGLAHPTLQAAERIRAFELPEKARAGRERLQARLDDFERLNALLAKRSVIRARLFRAFPGMKNLRHTSAFHEMRQRFWERVRRRK